MELITKAVIVAGGKGIRLRLLTNTTPNYSLRQGIERTYEWFLQ